MLTSQRKVISQIFQENGLASAYTLVGCLEVEGLDTVAPQISRFKGFSTVSLLECWPSIEFKEAANPQTSQWYDLVFPSFLFMLLISKTKGRQLQNERKVFLIQLHHYGRRGHTYSPALKAVNVSRVREHDDVHSSSGRL